MKAIYLAGLGTVLIAIGAPAGAYSFTDFSLLNNSDANEATTGPGGLAREFRTVAIPDDSEAGSGDGYGRLRTTMQMYSGFQGDGGTGQNHNREISYDVYFTIEDPANEGYSVVVHSILAGQYASAWESGLADEAVQVSGLALSGRIDMDLSDGDAGLLVENSVLSTDLPATASSDFFDPEQRQFHEYHGVLNLGLFEGTRQFGLRFTSVGNPTANIFIENGNAGQGSISYGLENMVGALDGTGQLVPQGPQSPRWGYGHTVLINANVVPVPPALMLLGSALASLLAVRRRARIVRGRS